MIISNNRELVRRDSIEELCGHRERALQLYAQAMDTLKAAKEAHGRACGGGHFSAEFLRNMHHGSRDAHFDKATQQGVDRDMWQHFVAATKLGSLMDEQERRRFDDSLKTDVPEVTPETVFATLSRLAGDANMIFRRGLVTAFRHFCTDYKSHDGFKIGPRFIVTNAVSGGSRYPNLNHYKSSAIQDLDRVMHVLDGKAAPEYQEGICAAMRTAMAAKQDEASTEYWRVRMFFGNGNAHFYPLRDDLREMANRLIAEHYGETLGAGHSARHAA
jgi:hypothetical protein